MSREGGLVLGGAMVGLGIGYILTEYIIRDRVSNIISDYIRKKDKVDMVTRWWKLFFAEFPDPSGLNYYVNYAIDLESRGYNDAHVALFTGIAILQGGPYNQPAKYVTFPEPP